MATATNLGAGSYTVTVTDAVGSTTTSSVTLTEPTLVVASISAQTNVACNGNNTGSATASANGGTAGYTYLWSDGQTTATATGLAAGMYTVTVTDANGCTATSTATITEPSAVNLSVGFPISLAGTTWKMAPQAQALGVGPTQGSTLWWSNNIGDVTTRACFFDDEYIFNADGSFSNVLGTDTWLETWQGVMADMCGTPVAPHDGTAAATWTYDANAGTITLNGNGAYLGLPKVHNNGELPGVPAPASITYQVSFTGNAEMTLDINFGGGWWRFVLEKTAPSPITNVSCNGGSDGSATVNATGGTAPYTYAWPASAGNQTTATATGLSAGTYDVTATDANNCTATTSVTVTEPTAVSVAVAASSPLLAGTTWKVAPQAQALAIGPTQGSTLWWSNNIGDVTTRACFFDDEYVFNADGSFSNVLGADTWLENWQTGVADACGAPVAPHDGTAMATWAYDDMAGTMTINGTGAYLGLSKVYNGGELSSPAGAVASITYIVTAISNNEITLDIDIGGAWWRFILEKTASQPPVQQLTNVTCNGGNDGSATVEATGGTMPYTYAWPASAGSQTTAAATNLAAGTYVVTATDANDCTATTSVTIAEPTALATTLAQTNVDCNGNSTGSATVTASGGTPGYTYAWSNGPTTATISGLAAGMYTVTVTDANNCTTTAAVTIIEPAVLTATSTATDVTCNGAADGAVNLTVAGGTMPYTYAWSNMTTTEDLSGLSGGTYNVTITDANGCTATSSATVNEPTALTTSAVVSSGFNGQDISCNGATDGTIDLTVGGGTMPYTYAWDNGAGMMEDPSGLGAGTYTVTVTDANGCTITASATLTEPTALTATAAETQQASCSGGNDGKAMATPIGGTMPYTYAWDANAANQTTQEASNLAAGTYSVTITDVNGCTTTASATVTSPSGLATTINVFSNVSCNGGSDGAVNLTVTGGTMPFTYAWNNGATTEDIFEVPAGIYSVTITDANGCSISDNATVTEPATALTATATGDALDCNGDTDGIVDLTVTGGVAPYAYAWDNGATTEDLANVGAGTYNVVITDVNGCSTTASATVTEPMALTASASATDASCSNTTDGTVDLTVMGGTMPYTYAWSSGETTEDISSVGSGTYDVTVTDANGCTATASATVGAPTAIVITGSITDALCNGDANGAVDISVSGGAGGYTFAWSNMATTEDLSNVAAGTYTVTVTDMSGCSDNMSFSVNEPGTLTVAGSATDVNCFGGSDGAINVMVTGGTMPYTYAWDSTAIGNDGSPTGLLPGTYGVTVTDANGCSKSNSYTITSPMAALSLSTTSTNALCIGGNDGSIDLTVAGGTAPYTYAWDNNATTEDLSGLTAGTYMVVVTDANGCSETTSVTITQPSGISFSSSTMDVTCNGDSTGNVQVTVSGGTAPYTYMWSDGSTNEDLMNAPAGTYTLVVTDANGCTSSITRTINEPTAIMLAETITDVSCNSGNDGSIMLSVTGGTAPYTMTWSGGVNPTALMAGTYSVTVTDANGCTEMATYTVDEPTLLLAIGAVAQPIACAGDSGAVTVTIGGGTQPYTTVWTDAAGNVVNENSVPAGTYTATVTDANGCTTTSSATLVDPVSVSVDDIMTTDALCAGDANGTIDLVVSGGMMPYTYSWSNASFGNTGNVTNAVAGTHTVTVTDANGCSTTATATVGEPTALTVNPTSIADTNDLSIGIAIANVSGGTPPYSISWDNGMTGDTIMGLGFGTYTVNVTDGNGCATSGAVQVDSILTDVNTVLNSITNLNVFPNPTQGNVTIDLEMSDARDVNVSIYSISGQLIRDFGHEYTSRAQIRTDMSIFPSGVYMVRFVIDDQVVTKRLILSKY